MRCHPLNLFTKIIKHELLFCDITFFHYFDNILCRLKVQSKKETFLKKETLLYSKIKSMLRRKNMIPSKTCHPTKKY